MTNLDSTLKSRDIIFFLNLCEFLFKKIIYFNWSLITLQYCSGFCHTLTWISHGFTCVPHPEPPSHFPPHSIPLSYPCAPALSTLSHARSQRYYFANKGPSSQGCGFSSSHVWMWELDYKESWVLKNWCFWTVVLEKTVESLLDCKEIQPVHPKGDQSWIFIGRTDAEPEAPILWPLDVKNWLIWKDPDTGKDWRQEEKGTTEDEMVGWHHRLNGHEFE